MILESFLTDTVRDVLKATKRYTKTYFWILSLRFQLIYNPTNQMQELFFFFCFIKLF